MRIQLESPGQSSITEGSDISIACLIDSNPAPHGPLIWKHNEHKLSVAPGSGISAKRNRLHIRNVRHAHAGNYTCEVSNNQGSGVSSALYLRIKRKKKLKHYPTFEAHRGRGFGFEGKVVVSLFPVNLEFREDGIMDQRYFLRRVSRKMYVFSFIENI